LTGNPVYRVADPELASPEVLAWDLGAGETQVIAHALRHGADRVILDDLEARRCAKAMGLRVIGTLGIVGRAKAMGRIAQATPVIEHLRRTGLYGCDEFWTNDDRLRLASGGVAVDVPGGSAEAIEP
jgi:predicted nucleic acid-binding protein